MAKQCERCGTENPATNNFCGNCGSALPQLSVPVAEQPAASAPAEQAATSTPSSGFAMYEAPTESTVVQRPAPRSTADDLPDWLQDLTNAQRQQPQALPLPATPRPEPAPVARASDPEAPTEVVAASQHELPAWLRSDIEDIPTSDASAAPPAAVPSMPSWLMDQPGDAPSTPAWLEQPAPQAPADQWVADAPGAASPTPQPTADNSLPSWLVANPAQSPDAAAPTQAPDTEAAPSTPPRAPADGASASSLPRWLLDDDEDDLPPPSPAPTASAPTADESVLPAWLRDTQPAQTNDDALPSWAQTPDQTSTAQPSLQPDATVTNLASAAPAASPTPPAAPALPSWLLQDDTPPPADAASTPGQGDNWLAATPAERNEPTLPGWLIEPDGAADAPAASAPQSSSGLPDWLVEQSNPTGTPAPTEEQPDWLQMIGQGDSSTDTAQPRQSGTPNQGTAANQQTQAMNAQAASPPLPDWLMPTAEETAAQPQQAPAPEPEDDVPAWLRDFTTDQQTPITQQPEPRAVDQWLTDTGPEPPSFAAIPVPETNESRARIYDVRDEEEELDTATPPQSSTPLPAWLAGQSNQTGDAPWALPPWLSEADNTTAQPEAAPAPVAAAQPSTLPAWLQPEEPSAAAATTPTTNAAPSWLHVEDDAVPTQATAQFPTQPTVELPAQTTAPMPVATTTVPIDTTSDRAEASSMLERVLDEPEPEPVVTIPPAPQRSIWISTIIPLIAFVLIVAGIIFALFGPPLSTFFGQSSGPALASAGAAPVLQATRPYSPGVARFEQQATRLTAETPVLVVYATDGSHGAELGALESSIMADLGERQSPLVLVSTGAQGSLLGRERAASYSAPVLDLGYKPGGAVALARLAQDFGGAFASDATGRDLRADTSTRSTFCGGTTCALDRMGMVVVFADEAADARAWAEQVGSIYPHVPQVYAVTAESAPYVRPYVLSDDTTMLTGLSDAAALGTDAAMFPSLDRRADAVAAGGALWAGLVLVGALPALFGGLLRRRGGRGNPWRR